MKKEYLTPEACIELIVCERTFLASGENLTVNSTYLDNYTEDEFWD